MRVPPVTLPRAGDEGLDNDKKLNIQSALIPTQNLNHDFDTFLISFFQGTKI